MTSSAFLDACRRRATPFTPIWIMRQAGRYQPEYRALRQRVSFVDLCRSPELVAEVTVRPVEQLGVDAAIIFADILLILEPLGVPFRFDRGEGPRILSPIRSAKDIDAVLEDLNAEQQLDYVMEALRVTRRALADRVPLIGFAGAPFTLASYAIEGGGSRHYIETKRLMYSDPGAWDVLMRKLTEATARYTRAQVAAGAQAIQIFDSWVGCLSPSDYQAYVAPHMKRLFDAMDASVPRIHFGTGNAALYPSMCEAGGDVIGLDWRVHLGRQWRGLGEDRAVMGNLDPVAVLGPSEKMKQEATRILEEAAGRPGHVFNLGHGVLPDSSVDQVRALVDHVHEQSAQMRSPGS